MLGEAGSIASLVGLPLTFAALLFAIYHLSRLRGEARAARDAAEEARGLLRRDLTSTDLIRLRERIQDLIELHRSGTKAQALDRYPEILGLLREIRRQHPNLPDEHLRKIQAAMATLNAMQDEMEALEGNIAEDTGLRFNRFLRELQTNLLLELEDLLESFESGEGYA